MNLLLCLPNANDFDEVLQHLKVDIQETGSIVSTNYLAHQIDILLTSNKNEETQISLAKTLALKRYHLALYAGFATSWKAEIPIGTIVNVIREKSAENADFSNRNNNYLNIFFEFRKVLSASREIAEKADIISENGMAFVSQCAKVNQPFYQLRSIEKNDATGEFNPEKAKENLNKTLITILAVI